MRNDLVRVVTVGRLFLSSLARRPSARRRPTASPKLCAELLESRDLLAVMSPTYTLFRVSGVLPLSTSGPTGTSPSQIRHAYGIDQITFNGGTVAGDGSGTTIAIVDAYDDPNIANDLHQFDLRFGLPDPIFTKVNQNGGSTMPSPNGGWISEIALDVEWSHAIAPKANILLVEANSSSNSDLFQAVRTAARTPGVVAVSMSWAGGESSGETGTDASTFVTPAGHAGVTFFASSGDTGAPAVYPSASPNVVSVGGTTLITPAWNKIKAIQPGRRIASTDAGSNLSHAPAPAAKRLMKPSNRPCNVGRSGGRPASFTVPFHVVVQVLHRVQLRRVRRQVEHLDLVPVRRHPGLHLRRLVGLQPVRDQQDLPRRPRDQPGQEQQEHRRVERPLVRHEPDRPLVADGRDLVDPDVRPGHLHRRPLPFAGVAVAGVVVRRHADLVGPQNLGPLALRLGFDGGVGLQQPLLDLVGVLLPRMPAGFLEV